MERCEQNTKAQKSFRAHHELSPQRVLWKTVVIEPRLKSHCAEKAEDDVNDSDERTTNNNVHPIETKHPMYNGPKILVTS